MKYLLFILLFITTTTYGQNDEKYNAYLFLNSKEKEMVINKTGSDSIDIKTFFISKSIPKENYKYYLDIDKKGNIIKIVKGSTLHKNESLIILSSVVKCSKAIKFSRIQKNIIDYNMIINSNFNSFRTLLKNATKIFIIDKSDDYNDDYIGAEFYKGFEVKLM